MSRCRNAREALPGRLLKQVQAHCAGSLLWIPAPERRRLKTAGDAARDEAIRRERQAGKTYRQLGLEFRISASRAWEIVNVKAPQVPEDGHAASDG